MKSRRSVIFMRPQDMEVYGTVKVGERGQVVIPSNARSALKINPGDKLLVISTPHRDGIAMLKAEVVKEMIERMNLGLSRVHADSGRASSTRRAR